MRSLCARGLARARGAAYHSLMMPRISSTDPSRRITTLALLAAVALLVGACNSQRLTAACTGIPSRAIVVAVRDSLSGAAAADNSLGTITMGGVVDTLVQSDSLLLFGGTRLGTYDVKIERPGYLDWTLAGVHVTQLGSCGNVVPVQLSARLQPATP